MRILKKIGNRTIIINIPSLDGGELPEIFIEIVFLITEDGFLRITEDGLFERILE